MKKIDDTLYFHFHNANPKGKNKNDCVARAISVALGQSWETTIREMTEKGISIGAVFNEDSTIDAYLLEKGWTRCKEPRNSENKKITVKEFLNNHKKGIYIIRAGSHHLSLIFNGRVWDTWDCSKKVMHSYFYKEWNDEKTKKL